MVDEFVGYDCSYGFTDVDESTDDGSNRGKCSGCLFRDVRIIVDVDVGSVVDDYDGSNRQYKLWLFGFRSEHANIFCIIRIVDVHNINTDGDNDKNSNTFANTNDD